MVSLEVPPEGIPGVVEVIVRVGRVSGRRYEICDLYIMGCAEPGKYGTLPQTSYLEIIFIYPIV